MTNQEMTADVRESLTKQLLNISGHVGCVVKRPLEVTVVNQSDIHPWKFPPRCEYMYGEWLREEMEAGKSPQPCNDPDIAILLWQAKRYSVTIKGLEARKMIPHIPFPEIQKAVKYSLPSLTASLKGDERNVLLTLSRMWFTLETGEITTKDAAAEWALPKLPEHLSPFLKSAQEAYLGKANNSWDGKENEDSSFSNVNPSRDNWINGFFGIGGFYLCCVANYDAARAEVVLARGNKQENKDAFDSLYTHKAEIESALGTALQWNRGKLPCGVDKEVL